MEAIATNVFFAWLLACSHVTTMIQNKPLSLATFQVVVLRW
jgi:hypothetical protein